MELANKLKPNCLLKTSVLWPFANKFVIKIVFIVRLVLILGYGTILREEYYSNILMLRSECFEKGNI